mgnify:CR=1 FL=1
MSLSKVRAETAKRMGPSKPEDELLSCRYCGADTARAILSELGSRCRVCYDAYCRDAFAPRPRAQMALPRTPGRISVLASGEPKSAGPEHAFDALPFD